MAYGISYMGSKNKIADSIIAQLPKGKRLVDLFGGGAAISHAAVLSKKWNSVIYNELKSDLCNLIEHSLSGFYSYDIYRPKWVSRDEFSEQTLTDAYSTSIWAFGNMEGVYLFGKDNENYKRLFHQFAVFGENNLSEMTDYINEYLFRKYSISEKINLVMPYMLLSPRLIRLDIRRQIHNFRNRLIKNLNSSAPPFSDFRDVQQLQQLERLERMQSLASIGNMSISNKSYLDVKLLDGDVVYCDPPYADTISYSKDGFDHNEFWNWVRQCPHCVIVSEYSAPCDIKLLSSISKVCLVSGGNRKKNLENLYWNGIGNLTPNLLF